MISWLCGRRREVRRAGIAAKVVLVCEEAQIASWPLAAWCCPDLGVVDQLARWQLAARRMGCSIRLCGADAELSGLLDLAGLSEIVQVGDLEPGGEPEGSEQVGVQEVVMPDDPVT
jgi:hypothetical protein